MIDSCMVADSLQNADMVLDSATALLFDTPMSFKEIIIETVLNATKSQFFQGGALLGILAWAAIQFKNIPLGIWNRIKRACKYTVYFDTNDDIYEIFTKWLFGKYPKKFRNVLIDIKSGSKALNRDERYTLDVKQNQDWNYIFYKGSIVIVEKKREILQNSSNPNNRYIDSYSIYTFFGRNKLMELMEELRLLKVNDSGEGLEFYYNGSYDWTKGRIYNHKQFDDIYFDGKEDLVKDLDNFVANADKHHQMGIGSKRGYLLVGPPGNGKTSLAITMGIHLNMDLYFVNLSTVDDDTSFIDLLKDMNKNSILVFEDIDAYAKARLGEKDKTKINFSTLLNSLNGIFEPNNCIVIMTTNDKSVLDPALIRPGRIDKIIEVKNPTWKYIKLLLTKFYGEAFLAELYKIKIDDNKDFNVSMSTVQDLCLTNPSEFGFYQVINQLNILRDGPK